MLFNKMLIDETMYHLAVMEQLKTEIERTLKQQLRLLTYLLAANILVVITVLPNI